MCPDTCKLCTWVVPVDDLTVCCSGPAGTSLVSTETLRPARQLTTALARIGGDRLFVPLMSPINLNGSYAMTIVRRRFLQIAAGALGSSFVYTAAWAENY